MLVTDRRSRLHGKPGTGRSVGRRQFCIESW
jgi:hypothetical protein